MMKFMLITNNPELAKYADCNGVARLFVDLEQLGKQERQGHLNTLISNHSMSDVAKIKNVLSTAELLVRLNPLNQHSKREVDDAIDAGADLLMLPMFYSAQEVQEFSDYVGGRVGIIPLVETFLATQCIDDIVKVSGVSEIYIGLNDLHLDMKLNFMFEPLANGLVDKVAEIIHAEGLPFGFGGVARVGDGVIPGELILAEHHRLGSSSVILSRTFQRLENENNRTDFSGLKQEIIKLTNVVEKLRTRSEEDISDDQHIFQGKVTKFVAERKQ